jgi:hypothetical protein
MHKLFTKSLTSTLAFTAVLLFLVSTTTNAQAQSYTSNEGHFSVTFPAGTTVSTKADPINYKDGTTGTMNEFAVELEGGNVAYMVLYNDYTSAQANGDPQSVLANTRDGAVSGKTLLTDSAVTLNGVPGRAFTAKDDDWNYSVRQYLKGKRLYQLIVVSNAAHPATQIDQFMNSFTIF